MPFFVALRSLIYLSYGSDCRQQEYCIHQPCCVHLRALLGDLFPRKLDNVPSRKLHSLKQGIQICVGRAEIELAICHWPRC
jgi:hypothetical protein